MFWALFCVRSVLYILYLVQPLATPFILTSSAAQARINVIIRSTTLGWLALWTYVPMQRSHWLPSPRRLVSHESVAGPSSAWLENQNLENVHPDFKPHSTFSRDYILINRTHMFLSLSREIYYYIMYTIFYSIYIATYIIHESWLNGSLAWLKIFELRWAFGIVFPRTISEPRRARTPISWHSDTKCCCLLFKYLWFLLEFTTSSLRFFLFSCCKSRNCGFIGLDIRRHENF